MPKRLTTQEFVAKAKAVHGGKYDYSKSEYVDKKTSVVIVCPLHGEFKQTPHHHLRRKQGCPICARIRAAKNNTKSVEDFLKKAHAIHGNRYDYSKIEHVNRLTPINIVCKEHGEFMQTPSDHINGKHGCPKCAIQENANKARRTISEFIEKAHSIHGHKYDYSKVSTASNKDKITIICPIHGDFIQGVADHLSGHGCPECAGKAKKDTGRFIREARIIHGDRYDYSYVEYSNLKTKVKIICREHGGFLQEPTLHLSGCGCPICGMLIRRTIHYGVGLYDVPTSETQTPAYKAWHGMMLRCYGEKTRNKFPTYSDVDVCIEWHSYSIFKCWFESNYIIGYDLDKDIVCKKSKLYSPETCCFVPHEINTILTNNKAKRGFYPIGVRRAKNRFQAVLSCRNKRIYLGSFDTPEEAFAAYKSAKETYIKEIATEYFSRGEITKRVYDALMRYEVDITD